MKKKRAKQIGHGSSMLKKDTKDMKRFSQKKEKQLSKKEKN